MPFVFVLFCLFSDEVIRKRLLIDGDGAGDDRRINLLLKSFTKWCNSPGTPEEGSVVHSDSVVTIIIAFFKRIIIKTVTRNSKSRLESLQFSLQVHPVSEDVVQSGPVRILDGKNLNGL